MLTTTQYAQHPILLQSRKCQSRPIDQFRTSWIEAPCSLPEQKSGAIPLLTHGNLDSMHVFGDQTKDVYHTYWLGAYKRTQKQLHHPDTKRN